MAYTHLYGFTVQGIQAYIFQTNNLREIIGASEIVEAVCTTWFDEFINDRKEKNFWGAIQMAAGNIKFFTSIEHAKIIFREYAKIVNQKAPGLPFSQAVVEGLDIDMLNTKLSSHRNVPLQNFDTGHMGRFHARSVGDMAVKIETNKVKHDILKNYEEKRRSIDLVNFQKFIESENANKALLKKAGINSEKELVEDFEKMAKDGKHSWLALVHIDGNGMGKKVKEIVAREDVLPYEKAEEIREFARSIAESTEEAFKEAYRSTFSNHKGKKPFRPLILGGDDVTFMIRADYAMLFVKSFLEQYMKETDTRLEKAYTSCAGIAFVKAKFPFHYSAELVEDICKYAKDKSERKFSCVRFHKVSDSFISDYKELMKRELTFRDENEDTKIAKDYYTLEEIDKISKTINELNKEEGDKNKLRQWVDLKLNNAPEAVLIKDKLKDDHTSQAADLLSLMAVS